MTDTDVLSISHLFFTYPQYEDTGVKHSPLFEDLSLSLKSGSITVIAGLPEAGKTSLAQLICGLTPRYSGGEMAGTILLCDMNVTEQKPQDLMDRVGVIFQNPDEQLITTRVDSEIAFPLESLGLPRSEIIARVDRVLDDFDLRDKAARNPATLSGGEKKRLLCAVLQALGPSLWVMDETIDEIDREWQRKILDLLHAQGTGVLLFSSKLLDLFGDYHADLRLLTGGSLITDPKVLREKALQEGLLLSEKTPPLKKNPANRGPLLLAASDLRFSYSGDTDFALRVDSFEVRAGEILSLVGPNGCGKTTLAKLLCGLLIPSKGRITVLPGEDTGPVAVNRLKTTVAYIFQNPDYQIFLPTVREELAFGLKEFGYDNKTIAERVHRAIDLFRLPSPESSPSMMSYGTRKRLQAATYWLLERPVCILDEADSGLSPGNFSDLVELFRDEKRAIIVITHNEELAERFSTRLVAMDKGSLK